MAVICTFRAPGVTPEKYDQIRIHLAWEATPPDGGMAHFMSFDEDGAIEVDIWDSEEGFRAFFEGPLAQACRRFEVMPRDLEIREIYLMALAAPEKSDLVPRAITPAQSSEYA